MTISLADVKTYCRVDGDDEDTLIQNMVEAAKVYLENAGIPDPAQSNQLYALAVKALVLNFYDNRGTMQQSGMEDIPGMQNIITQLKLSAVVEGFA